MADESVVAAGASALCEEFGWQWERESDAGALARSSTELATEGVTAVLKVVEPLLREQIAKEIEAKLPEDAHGDLRLGWMTCHAAANTVRGGYG